MENGLPSVEQTNETAQTQQVILNEKQTPFHNKFKCPQFSIIIEILTFITFFGDALAGPLITNLLLSLTCENHFKFNKSVCDQLQHSDKNASEIEAIVQPYTSVIVTGMNFLSLLLPAVMSLFLGSWSDTNGRKYLIIVPSIGYFLKFMLLGSFSYIKSLNPALGLVAVIPVALTGGFINLITALYSYVSDITTDENRSFRLSILEACMICGGIVGLSLTSPLFKLGDQHGYALVFGIAAGASLLSMILAIFFLPESVEKNDTGKGLYYVFELSLLKEMVKTCFKKRKGFQRAALFLVITAGTTTICQMEGESNILFLFTRLKFDWSVLEYTQWNVISLASGLIGLILGTLILVKYLKISDPFLGIISHALKAASCFYIAFIPSNAPSMMYYTGLISSVSGLGGPAGRAILTKIVSKNEIGKFFALTGSCETLFPLAVAPLYTWIYNSTISIFPSAVFLVSGSLFIINTIIFICLQLFLKTADEPESAEDDRAQLITN